jgi:hypothetical protein
LGSEYLGSVCDRLIVDLGLHRVCGVLLNLQGVDSLRGWREANRLHVGELVIEYGTKGSLDVDVVGEVYEELVGVDVGVFGRVDSCEVLVLDEDGVVRR